ncbi:hypothetical protein K1719_038493 [Acacia pycnantha]|nr:hypothetical protein K1719_038493 [Acacia pycnantha]
MLDLETLLHDSSNVIRIADLGCSVGPNTFFIFQNFIDTLNLKSQSQGHGFDSLEFQVFFNDHVGNDFNTLFKSLPEEKQYYARRARFFSWKIVSRIKHSCFQLNLCSSLALKGT